MNLNYSSEIFQIERSLDKHLDVEAVQSFKDFMIKKEKLTANRKELSDKMKLCKKQMIELEFAEKWKLDRDA